MSGVVGVVFAGGLASRGGDQSAGVIKGGWSHRTTSESHTQTTPIGMSRNVTSDHHACPCVPGAVPSHVFVTHTARSRHSAAQHWPSVAPPSDSPSSTGRSLCLKRRRTATKVSCPACYIAPCCILAAAAIRASTRLACHDSSPRKDFFAPHSAHPYAFLRPRFTRVPPLAPTRIMLRAPHGARRADCIAKPAMPSVLV